MLILGVLLCVGLDFASMAHHQLVVHFFHKSFDRDLVHQDLVLGAILELAADAIYGFTFLAFELRSGSNIHTLGALEVVNEGVLQVCLIFLLFVLELHVEAEWVHTQHLINPRERNLQIQLLLTCKLVTFHGKIIILLKF